MPADDMADEQEIFRCGFCTVPILTFWDAEYGGLLRGEYMLGGDAIFHKKCWDRHVEPLYGKPKERPDADSRTDPC